MSLIIGVAGKGGTGKTLIAGLLVRGLRTRYPDASILAIDADPDANLAISLGVKVERSVGDIREQLRAEKDNLPPGMSKRQWLDAKVFEITVEAPDFDLLAMGRPEGRGCYCSVNHFLRDIIDNAGDSYDYIVIDSEAGMEHLSRRTTRDVDRLVIVTDQSLKSLTTTQDIIGMSKDLELAVKKVFIAANKIEPSQKDLFLTRAGELGLDPDVIIPFDARVVEMDLNGRSVLSLDDGSAAFNTIEQLATKLFT